MLRSLLLTAALTAGGVVVLADQAAALAELPCTAAGGQVQCSTSDFSRAYQVQVPERFGSALVNIVGGEGGSGAAEEVTDRTYLRAQTPGPRGGAGGSTSTTVMLTPGQIIDIYVGGPGGNAADCTGGSPGKSGGLDNGGAGGNGFFDGSLCGGTAGGGGGGGTFVLPHGRQPGQDTPLAAAGGGGGGSGSGPGDDGGGAGGRGGGSVSGLSQNGASAVNATGGGLSGDASRDLPGVGSDGANGVACPSPPDFQPASTTSSDCPANYGGGGGGGGRFGGHGGGQAEGGGGGSGVPTGAATDTRPAGFHAAQIGGSFSISFTTPGDGGAGGNGGPNVSKGGGPSSNDPNPNTNPPQRSPADVARTTTVLCQPRIGFCRLGPIVGPDSVFNVYARGGANRAELFGTLQGGSRPDCPNYTEKNSDWLAFGFRDPLAGSTWRKTASLRTRHQLTRAVAEHLSRQLQICFEAPYRFVTRDGYALGGHNTAFDGVLPDCSALSTGPRESARPCVTSRQVVARKSGWVVRLTFRMPTNGQDPKALG